MATALSGHAGQASRNPHVHADPLARVPRVGMARWKIFAHKKWTQLLATLLPSFEVYGSLSHVH